MAVLRMSSVVNKRLCLIALAAAAAVSAIGAGAAAATTIFVQSPSRAVACEVDSHAGAICTVFALARQASVSQHGRVRVFAQDSNPPSGGVRTLRRRHSVRAGEVRCSGVRAGVRCVQLTTRHGFVATRKGFRRF